MLIRVAVEKRDLVPLERVENDYEKDVYNGDLEVVRSIDPETSEMVIEFDGREVTYGFGELDDHSQEPGVRVSGRRHLTTQHYSMLQRNLLYTAVTPGKRLVVIVGQKKALAIAVKRAGARRVVEARGVAG